MKKLVILVLAILIYSSVFPTYLLAENNTELDTTENQSEADEQTKSETTVSEESSNDGIENNSDAPEDSAVEGETETETSNIKEEQKEESEDSASDEIAENVEESEQSEEVKSIEEDSQEENQPKEEKIEGSEENNESVEYNQFGIKEGTEVYGIDISEFSEEELQYVPKGWRDGVVESEHPHETQQRMFSIRSVYPDVNDYISNIPVAKVEYQYKDFFEKFNYRHGFGQVEGVVAHETANDDSSITQEISYMSRNHENAFVHAFVDHERIIEIHPLDLGAWGAGPYANQRFVHVELVRVNNFEQFAKSINNYADYIASILYNYGLGVDSAESDGKGTLWSHKAVSNYLGGTTHVDPHGYFDRYGYSWSQFVSLVKSRYDSLDLAKPNTSRLGHLHGDARIFKYPGVSSSAYSAKEYTNAVYYIKSKTEAKGGTYYLISREPSSRKGVIGWVKASEMDSYSHNGVDSKKKTFYLRGTGTAYSKAWGGSKDIVYSDLSKYKGQEVKIDLTEKVGNNYWYRGTFNGKRVWIHTSNLTTRKESNTSKLGHLHGNAVIYERIGVPSTSQDAAGKFTNAVYYIKKQAEVNDQLYYLISTKPSSSSGTVGWVKSQQMDTHSHQGVDSDLKTMKIKGTGSAYSTAWGGAKDLVFNSLAQFENQNFHVHLTERVGGNTWYRGSLNGQIVWIHSSYLTYVQDKTGEKVSKLGHLRHNAKIYRYVGDNSSDLSNSNEYTNAVYYIKEQMEVDGQLYYLISTKPSSTKGVVGWVKPQDMVTNSHKNVDSKAKTFYLSGSGSAYSKAWGGSKNLVFENLSKYRDAEFKVNLTETVGNNTWYRGKLNGKTVWLHSSYVGKKEESTISRLGHLRSSATILETLGVKSTALNTSEFTNAVYYIKKQADINGRRYYLISTKPSSTNGTIGWVEQADMITHKHVSIDKDSKTFVINGNGKAYSKAWGGKNDLVYDDLSQFKQQNFKVNLTESVGNNTWYRGVLNGKTVWIHSSYVE
ncbi:GW dipeptide domain-containing protein [Virgibacillus senegalensis]|uniref:GW dipeptide domain-containing protein n=1 Tax=Virgibacillus senegalensis TaxID=1499679 RepID=UPI00069F27F7|nr:N-acetylmuramoyl-L-alanine amidase [Virgibacillus senegalensis]